MSTERAEGETFSVAPDLKEAERPALAAAETTDAVEADRLRAAARVARRLVEADRAR